MSQELPKIYASPGIMRDIAKHRGEPCLVRLKVKYSTESDWVRHEVWMPPGWESAFIWKSAFDWMKSEQMYTKYKMSEVEEAEFYEFKLV